ncbi:hypothetical protein N0B44_17290 [Roseibacterium beibuensis]|uniref:hypothetical protein n=1 Tax=[Roseibacterium] beibuensis TaxID=1193142 RepID=UPI00217E13BD|nr:hypothetical protein [Roseibacterium beibuensis]MCS6624674.1 hypothetical protein [Roseibacterium beibuensis]
MRKTALLSGVAGLFLMTAPAIAQDGTAPQTPPTATPPAQDAQPAALTLSPGMTVRGSDGDLGVLVGARTNAGAQQLTVQGADGTVRAVPITGIRQDGEVVVVDFTLEQFNAAETVTTPATPAEPAEPGVTPATPATPAVPGVPAPPPTVSANPADDANPPPTEQPVSPPPTLPPENPAEPETPPAPTPATPVPGEGADQEPEDDPGA